MKRLVLVIETVLFLLVFLASGRGEIYRFEDSAGVIHFSNVPTDPRYRPLSQEKTSRRPRVPILNVINRVARHYGVDPALVRAVVKAESNFNPDAVSYMGAQGLMQLMPRTAVSYDVRDPFDPEENITGGVRYLKRLLTLFNQEVSLAVAAYHAGENNVFKVGGIPPIVETQHYVKRVLKFYRRYGGAEQPLYKGVGANGETLYTNRPERYSGMSFQKINFE
jgi:soluble lytic murein transglycosylase-like protein